jgi:hypothetical protein
MEHFHAHAPKTLAKPSIAGLLWIAAISAVAGFSGAVGAWIAHLFGARF